MSFPFSCRQWLAAVFCLGVMVAEAGVKTATQASAKTPDSSMQSLVDLLAGYRSFQAKFTQESRDQKGKVLQKVQGEMKLQKPGQFYWKAFQPYPQLLVSDGKKIRIYDEDLEQVVIRSYESQTGKVDLASLLENPSLLKSFYRISATENVKGRQSFTLALLTGKDDIPISALKFEFRARLLQSVEFTDALRQRTRLVFSGIVVNKPIPEAQFLFTPPKGASILDETLSQEKAVKMPQR